uniref:protein-histidine N-methyltransferase n=1 Tax=Opuntia streptacantha TaxID=393608 RepID=A0A7C8YYA4_OPUST
MAANSQSSDIETFRLFQSTDDGSDKPSIGGLGFLDFPVTPLPPPPPSVEVLPSEGSSSVKYTVEKVDLGVVTLLKGRVSTQEVLKLSDSDLVPGKYEGGLKLWEGSLDLVKSLDSEIQKGNLSFEGKRVLELGCGHGLPGIFACLKGAAAVHFQDFNAEVLQHLTIANVNANLPDGNNGLDKGKVRYFAGDWRGVDHILPYARSHSKDAALSADDPVGGYNVILMAETVYSMSTLHSLYELIKKCISRPHGVVYMAAKKYYFGVGGGSRRFLSIVEKDGVMTTSLIAEVADGSSNVREVWKLSFK